MGHKLARDEGLIKKATNRTKFVRMKHVVRQGYSWIVSGSWGPDKFRVSFADTHWGGPLLALAAANACAADVHIGWEKPITSRIVMYPFWRVPESTGQRSVFKTNSGLFRIYVSPHPKQHKTILMPKGTSLEDAVTRRNQLQRTIYDAYPINFFRG